VDREAQPPIPEREQVVESLFHTLRRAEINVSSLRLLYEMRGEKVHGLTVDGYDAFDLWEKLRDLVPQTSHWPVILGRIGEEDLPTERRIIATGAEEKIEYPDTQSILREAEKIDAIEWFENTRRQHIEFLKEGLERRLQKGYEEDAAHYHTLLKQPDDFQGIERSDWPSNAEPSSSWGIAAGITHDRDMNSYDVTIALLPTPHSWHAASVLKFGGWNACPSPHEHIAILRHWEKTFGAQVVCMTHDTIECLVSRPPLTRSDALLLARDQFYYCADIISQGVGSLDALAARLLKGEAWYFWWD
jgi:hypothetical protein